MRFSFFVLSVLAMALLVGCSSKQYFEPEKRYRAPAKSFGETIVSLSRDGATLKSGNYIGKSGIGDFNLGKGYRFLSQNRRYVLASDLTGVLKVINKKSGKTVHSVSLDFPVLSASMKNGMVAYVLNNNTFGIYRLSDKTKIIESPSEVTYAIDTRVASPIFIDNLAIIPMLDGKLIIVDIYDTDNAKVVYLSSDEAFNNIIYLARVGNTLIAATPNKIMTLGDSGRQEYTANISEVASSGSYIYLFTKEGRVIRLNHHLEVLSENKFKFAHFSAVTANANRVYALDQKGSLIVMSSNLKKFKIYDVGEVENPVFIAKQKLYKDEKVIDLSTLRL